MSKGVLLVNLGSPDSPAIPDVRRYLREFLMDKRVLDVPWLTRFCVVHVAILPSRPARTAHAYQSIWTKAGSPLIVTSQHVRDKLQSQVGVPVELAMRYQNPSIESAVRKLAGQGTRELLLIPLFPHYAMASYESAVERVKELAARWARQLRIEVEPPYFDRPDYIHALGASAEDYLCGGYDHLLFSFHGVPERQIRKSDPTGRHCLASADCCQANSPAQATCYRAQCFKTVAAFVRERAIPEDRYSVSFQSRLGRTPWLKPYTDEVIPQLAARGARKLLVICPAFVSDCLETIEEIGMRGRDSFLQAGGKEFHQIPCLNEHPLWIAVLKGMADRFVVR